MLLPLLCVQNTLEGLFGDLELCDFPDILVWILPGAFQPPSDLNLPS